MKKSGFTLIELLVVIAIIGVLVTLGLVAVNLARSKAKMAKAQHDIDVIYQAIATLANDSNEWPGHQPVGEVCSSSCGANEICGPDAATPANDCDARTLSSGLAGVVQNDTVTPYSGWNGPYMSTLPIDAWNHEYFFDTDYRIHPDGTPCDDDSDPLCVNAVVVGSYGPDGLGESTANAADLSDDVIKVIVRE